MAEQLRVAAGDGRLSAEELDERLEIALTARTYAELARVTRDLPSAAGTVLGAPSPKDVVRIDCHSSSVESAPARGSSRAGWRSGSRAGL